MRRKYQINSFFICHVFLFYSNLDKPKIVKKNHGTVVNEFEQVTLYRKIISNPLSNVSWYNGSDLFNTQWLVRNATFNIEKATCTDTRNFTLVANNGVQENDTALVELIVNCEYDIFTSMSQIFFINIWQFSLVVVFSLDIPNVYFVYLHTYIIILPM